MEATLGATTRKLQAFLDEHYDPGAPVAVLLGLKNDLDQNKLNVLKIGLIDAGLMTKVALGSTPEWSNALQLRFRKPSRKASYLKRPLAELLADELSKVGATTIEGIKVST